MLWRLVLLAMYPLMWLNVKHPVVAFSYPPLNHIAFILAMSIPFVLFVFSLRIPQRLLKAICITVLLPLMLQAGFWAGLAVIVLPYVICDGQSAFLSKGKTIEGPFWNLEYYHGDGYVVVTQEKSIIPGLLLVKEIYHTGGPDPIIQILDPYTIKIIAQPGMLMESDAEFRLNRFVYF